ncbi:MAG: hypothetical protein U0975_16305 [Erythrobacter sp.]|nr:hypothetical protein [Erythrobacter sp.]MDZ4274224.1 hypothetical protein [Erythrobacter sp.]
MAKPGRKPDAAAAKVARGTLKPTPDVLAQIRRPSDDVPVQFESLPEPAREVWDREIEHFIAGGAGYMDSAYINHTCLMMADWEVRYRLYQEGADGIDAPPITQAVELRTRFEGLGMAGAKSRVGRPGTGGAGKKVNAFAANGNKPRA